MGRNFDFHYDVIIIILMLRQLKKMEGLHYFFVFGSIKVKFGVKGNFGLLISNLKVDDYSNFFHFIFKRSK